MQIISRFFLIFFIFFLSIPTLVTFIEKKQTTYLFLDIEDEEVQKDLKDFKVHIKSHFEFPFRQSILLSKTKITSLDVLIYKTSNLEILVPPPEFS